MESPTSIPGTMLFQGLPIYVETWPGEERLWRDHDGQDGRTLNWLPYGYIRGLLGMDGEDVDCFVGPTESASHVYVVTTKKPPDFVDDDEQKCLLGFPTAEAARGAFLDHYTDPRFLGRFRAIPVPDFHRTFFGHVGGARPVVLKAGVPVLAGAVSVHEPLAQKSMNPPRRISAVVYHMAPVSARASIQRHGIDYRRGVPWQQRVKGAKRGALSPKNAPNEHIRANYVWAATSPALSMKRNEPVDVWAVDTRGLNFVEHQEGGLGWTWRTSEPIPPKRIRLVQTSTGVRKSVLVVKAAVAVRSHTRGGGTVTGYMQERPLRGLARRAVSPNKQGRIPASGSDVVALFFEKRDAAGLLAQEFEQDVSDAQVRQAQRQIYEHSQRLLERRGLPETVRVYRGGPLRNPDTPTPVTLNADVARRFALQYGERTGIIRTYTVPRSKILADISGLLGRFGLDEEELLVYGHDLQPVEKAGVPNQTMAQVRRALTDADRQPRYRGNPNCLAGHCYVASEALYHTLGGAKSDYVPHFIRHENSPHWFLRHRTTGTVLDPTAGQFRTPVPYEQGRGKGFLTREPSKRAQAVMARMRLAKALTQIRPHTRQTPTGPTLVSGSAQQRRDRAPEPQPAFPDADTVFAEAKRTFGETDDPMLAGYVLPDGTMLDFSEGSGTRTADHRQIAGLDAYDAIEDRFAAMVHFMQQGAIRWMPLEDRMYGNASVLAEPTAAQYRCMVRAARERQVPLLFEVDDAEGRTIGGSEFDRPTVDALQEIFAQARRDAWTAAHGGQRKQTQKSLVLKARSQKLGGIPKQIHEAYSSVETWGQTHFGKSLLVLKARRKIRGGGLPGQAPTNPDLTVAARRKTRSVSSVLERIERARALGLAYCPNCGGVDPKKVGNCLGHFCSKAPPYEKSADTVKADRLPGGLADTKSPEDFDPDALAEGITVELEHTDDRALAREIAMDHLTEDPHYYRKLKRMEKAKRYRLGKAGVPPAGVPRRALRLFHGTEARHVESIFQQGLKSKKAGATFSESHRGHIYLTSDWLGARRWADRSLYRNSRKWTSPPGRAVIRVRIPGSELRRLGRDLNPHQPKTSYQFRGDIKPEWIESAEIHEGSFSTPPRLTYTKTLHPKRRVVPYRKARLVKAGVPVQKGRVPIKAYVRYQHLKPVYVPASTQFRRPGRFVPPERKLDEPQEAYAARYNAARAAFDATPPTTTTAPPFYSQLLRLVTEKMLPKQPPGDLLRMLQGKVKAEEIEWTTLKTWLAGKKSVTRDEVLDWLAEHETQIVEVEGGGKWGEWTLPGGQNYREILLRLPSGQEYRSPHWPGIPNVLVHLRTTDRTLPTGETVLFLEEIQSDWHQTGREEGYREPEPEFTKLPEGITIEPRLVLNMEARHYYSFSADGMEMLRHWVREAGEPTLPERARRQAIFDAYNLWVWVGQHDIAPGSIYEPMIQEALKILMPQIPDAAKAAFPKNLILTEHVVYRKGLVLVSPRIGHVGYESPEEATKGALAYLNAEARSRASKQPPRAPFAETWPYLGLKRALRLAAEEGYDALAWTSGGQQAERYKLSTRVDRLQWVPSRGVLHGWKDSRRIVNQEVTSEELPDYVGQALAEQLRTGKPVEGQDLDVGIKAQGMKVFYDEMLPQWAAKYVKPWGAVVTREPLQIAEAEESVNGWDGLSTSKQERIEEHWKDNNREGEYEVVVESWRENVPEQVREQLADDDAWWEARAKEWLADTEWWNTPGSLPRPEDLDPESLVEAVSGGWKDGKLAPRVKVEILRWKRDDSKQPDLFPVQADLARRWAPYQADFEEWFAGPIAKTLDELEESAEPPDYLAEEVTENLNSSWDSMEGDERMRYARQNDLLEEDEDPSAAINDPVHVIRLTPALKTAVLQEGQLLFSVRGAIGPGVPIQKARNNRLPGGTERFLRTADYAILTAENPGSRPRPRAENRARNAALLRDLRQRGYKPIRVTGQYGGTTERSYLVPGLTQPEGHALARKYRQSSWISRWAGRHRMFFGPHTKEGRTVSSRGHFLEGARLDYRRPAKAAFSALSPRRKFTMRFDWGHPVAASETARRLLRRYEVHLPDGDHTLLLEFGDDPRTMIEKAEVGLYATRSGKKVRIYTRWPFIHVEAEGQAPRRFARTRSGWERVKDHVGRLGITHKIMPGVPATVTKAVIHAHPRRTPSGGSTTVREHTDVRAAARPRQPTVRPGVPAEKPAGYKGTPPPSVMSPRLQALLDQLDADPVVIEGRRYLQTLQSTKAEHLDPETGMYTPERLKLHEEIADSLINPDSEVQEGETPTLVMMIGQPGSGKSTIAQSKVPAIERYTRLDADEVKTRLPDWDPKKAAAFHEESADILENELVPIAAKRRLHTLIDWVGKDSRKVLDVLREYKGLGYVTHLYYTKVPIETSVERAMRRARDKGRFVDPKYIVYTVDTKPDLTYQRAKESGLVDEGAAYDNSGSAPVTVDAFVAPGAKGEARPQPVRDGGEEAGLPGRGRDHGERGLAGAPPRPGGGSRDRAGVPLTRSATEALIHQGGKRRLVLKSRVQIRSYPRRGRMVSGYTQSRKDTIPGVAGGLPQSMWEKSFYHSTDEEAAGQAILASGELRPRVDPGRAFQSPISGRVYLSADLSYAAIYALGGVLMGHDLPDTWKKHAKEYGYIFEVKGRDVRNPYPDEDTVGKLTNLGFDPSLRRYLNPEEIKDCPLWLLDLAHRVLTPRQLEYAKGPEAAGHSMIGKKLVAAMTPAQRLEIIKLGGGGSLSHEGSLKIRRAWRVAKNRTKEIKPDGSNLLEIAEQVYPVKKSGDALSSV